MLSWGVLTLAVGCTDLSRGVYYRGGMHSDIPGSVGAGTEPVHPPVGAVQLQVVPVGVHGRACCLDARPPSVKCRGRKDLCIINLLIFIYEKIYPKRFEIYAPTSYKCSKSLLTLDTCFVNYNFILHYKIF